MNKRFTLPIFLLIALAGQGQITITDAEMPHAGDQLLRVRAQNNPQLNYAPTGPAHTWDFGNLVANAEDTTAWQTVASTNFVYAIVYANLPFNANRANHAKPGTDIAFSGLLPITDPYTFRYRSSSVYRTVGFGAEVGGIPLPILFDAQDVIYELPLQYGDSSFSHSAYHLDVPNVGYYGYQQDRANKVDGWGAITTPAGTFDVLRVKTTLSMRDSLFGFAFNRPVAREYKWLAQGLRIPVLQVNTSVVFGNEVITAIYYYDVPRSIAVVDPLAQSLCPGATLEVHYASTGAYNAGGFFVPANQFVAQLSDATGSFAAPVDIGTVTATESGVINATIPPGTAPGSGYRIRVISTSPDFIGESNAFDISIGGATVASITADGSTSLCAGSTLTLTAVGGPGYQWQLDGNDLVDATASTYVATEAGSYTVVVANGCGTATSNAIAVQVNDPPTHAVDATELVVCAGASGTLTATNLSGQDPLDYQWTLNDAPIAGANGLAVDASLAGIYNLVATNNATGCSYTTDDAVVSIDALPAPQVGVTGANPFCAGGSAELATDALPGASYQWYLDGAMLNGETTTTLTVGSAGSYTVAVTNANNCSGTSPAVVVVVNALPDAPTVQATEPTTFCEGGGVTLVADAPGAATYQWLLDGVEISGADAAEWWAQSAGAYSVSVTNAEGCAATSAAVDVVVNALPDAPAVLATEPTTFCEGGGVTLIADAPDATTYQWLLDGAEISGADAAQWTALSAGAYSVQITNAEGCTATSAAVDVVVNPLPSAPVIAWEGDSLVTSGGGSYQWYLDGQPIAGATDYWWQPTEDGNYTVVLTDANGCSASSAAWFFLTTGMGSELGSSMLLWPNPGTGVFNVRLSDAAGHAYEVLDAQGQRVLRDRFTSGTASLDLSGAAPGVYLLRIEGAPMGPQRIVVAH